MVKRCIWVLASTTAMLACSEAATTTTESVGEPAPKQTTTASKNSKASPLANTLRVTEALQDGQILPPVPGKMPTPTAFLDTCPDEKVKRQDFQQLSLAKAESKAAEAEKDSQEAVEQKLDAPDPKLLAAQDEFLAVARSKRRSFDAMKPEARERAYSELKASMLKEEE